MTTFINIFPLNLVVFPNEKLNLHIFEPRYKQLINDCFINKKPFGIPVVLNNELQEFGCTVTIEEIVKVYDDGKMDIKTCGQNIFRLLEIVNDIPDKLYNGAIVNYPDNYFNPLKIKRDKVLDLIRKLHQEINVVKDFKVPDESLTSYDLAHHIGLTIQEEYEILMLLQEDQRLEYIKRHISKMLFEIDRMNKLKTKIKLNGHFKELDGFNFTIFNKH